MTNSPTVWRRWLAFELRRLREERGLAQREVGRRCGWSGVRLSYLENLQQNVTEDDLAQLLPLYEVPPDRRGEFYEAAKRSRKQGFWERYDERIIPDWLTLYVGLEQGASAMRWVDVAGVPGLLQTPEYAAATMQTDIIPRTEQQIARTVETRMARQAVLSRGEAPLELSVIIDEAVLYRMAGGPDVMADQLNHMAALMDRPNITLKVFPFERGVNPCLVVGFGILTFPDMPNSGMVYIERRDGATYLERAGDVDTYTLAFGHLAGQSLAHDDSRELLCRTAEIYAGGRRPSPAGLAEYLR